MFLLKGKTAIVTGDSGIELNIARDGVHVVGPNFVNGLLKSFWAAADFRQGDVLRIRRLKR